jgi:hypothetical protein
VRLGEERKPKREYQSPDREKELEMATYDLTQAELSGVISANLDASVRDFVLNFLFNEDGSASPVSAPQDVPAGPGMGDNFADTQNATDNMILTSQDTGFNDAGNETILAGDGNDSILQWRRGRAIYSRPRAATTQSLAAMVTPSC